MKQKTHSGTKKRVRVSAKGKFSFEKSCRRHLLTNKSGRQKNISVQEASDSDKKLLKKLLKT